MIRPDAVGRRFTSRLHEPGTAARLGIALAVTFATCFVTGLYSHLVQQPPSWFDAPTRPAGIYRITQGVHVLTGAVSIPLLLAKLWTVFPKLFEWPPVRGVAHALERLALLPLVGGSLFMLLSGTANLARWYPWSFFFPSAHYAVAWVTVGAMAIHLGTKWSTVRRSVGRHRPADAPELVAQRRGFLTGVAATSTTLFLATAGNTITPLSKLAALAQRRPGVGPQGLPVNKSAEGAGVTAMATDPTYRLVVEARGGRSVEFTLAELRAMPQRDAELPIACVEGWSTSARWRGVPVAELLRRAGGEPGAVSVESLQGGGLYRRSEITRRQVEDLDTMLALELNGETLHLDHGYPVRLIGPGRPGVMQTKWVSKVVVA